MNENMIWLVPDLCGTIVNIKNHSLCSGRLSNKCRRDQYCALAHLSDDQINYVLSDIGSAAGYQRRYLQRSYVLLQRGGREQKEPFR